MEKMEHLMKKCKKSKFYPEKSKKYNSWRNNRVTHYDGLNERMRWDVNWNKRKGQKKKKRKGIDVNKKKKGSMVVSEKNEVQR